MRVRHSAKPVFQFYGGKLEMADWIISHFPPHHTFVDACGGSGAIILSKQPSPVEVYNDIDSGLVNFFRVVRNRPDELAAQLALMPYSRQEFNACRIKAGILEDGMARAVAYATVARQSSGGRWGQSWSRVIRHSRRGMASGNSRWLRLPEAVLAAAGRFQQVQIECLDVLECIRRYDTPATLFYIDPTYHPDVVPPGGYRFALSRKDHEKLVDLLNSIEGKALLSGYANELYDSKLQYRQRVEKTVACRSNVNTTGGTASRATRTEVLWIIGSGV